ncbi:WD-40 repeat-containing protein [Sparassis latifolia]
MSARPPPPPLHLLRAHTAQVNVVYFSDDNERLYSGDLAGSVVITSTRTLRSLALWQAHTDGLLGIEEWAQHVITHGRDNKLRVWICAQEPATAVGDSAVAPDLLTPQLCYSMDVNALNYCRFSLRPLSTDADGESKALLALPNLVESSLADVWTLPSQQRLHAAVGKSSLPVSPDGRGQNSTGIIMSMHLFEVAHPSISDRTQLRLLCAYENGSVAMWEYIRTDKETSIEGIGWERVWEVKLHVETVMGMTVSKDNTLALTVSADHLIGRYDLQNADMPEMMQSACVIHRTKNPGNSSIAIRDDGRVCAVGGWDGKVRLFSTKSMKPLGTLDYHKKSCTAVAFARQEPRQGEVPLLGVDEDNEDEMSGEEKAERTRWLAAGGQDNRVSIWGLISFDGASS